MTVITVLIRYRGEQGQAKAFAQEMVSSGLVDRIRAEEGNLGYEYFFPQEEDGSVLLVDRWKDQASLDIHHSLPLMGEIARLREKYDLHMEAIKLTDTPQGEDAKFIRR